MNDLTETRQGDRGSLVLRLQQSTRRRGAGLGPAQREVARRPAHGRACREGIRARLGVKRSLLSLAAERLWIWLAARLGERAFGPQKEVTGRLRRGWLGGDEHLASAVPGAQNHCPAFSGSSGNG